MIAVSPIYGPPNNNSLQPPVPPKVGVDKRLWCPKCLASVHKTRTPKACPDCLQPLVKVEVTK
jgi:hypothetical protein